MFKNASNTWQPATIEEVRQIVEEDLARCDAVQRDTFAQFAIEPRYTAINRYGNEERVVIVAKNGGEVIYWEDVEEGFNVSAISTEGRVLEHRCDQNDLGQALNAWIDGRMRYYA